MAHDIKPDQEHLIVNVRLALHTKDDAEASDGLNELFRPELGEGFIADYAFAEIEHSPTIKASPSPYEGELFDAANQYAICVQDSDYEESWYFVHSEHALAAMDEEELRDVLQDVLVIGQEDRIFVGYIQGMKQLTLNKRNTH